MAGIGLNGALNIGTQSLNAQRIAIETIGNNIANINTPGYARERANLIPEVTINAGLGEQGLGTKVSNITSLRSALLDGLVQTSLGAQGYNDNQSSLYSTVQNALGEQFTSSGASSTTDQQSNAGVQNALTTFFTSFQNLANTPTDSTARQLVVQNASSLATTINNAYTRVQSAQSDVATDATNVVSQINSLSQQIGTLNQQIKQVENDTGFSANSLRDNRVNAIEQLSALVNVTTTTASDGSITVALSDNANVQLVKGSFGGGNGNGTQSLSTTFNATAVPPLTITASSTGALAAGIPSGGSLGAHLDTVNNLIGAPAASGGTGLLGQIDSVATNLISQVNAQHKLGTDAHGNTGGNFFTGTGAADLAVSSTIVSDPSLVAASNGSGVLDGSNAQALAQLQSSSSILPAYQKTVTSLGASVASAANAQSSQDNVTKLLQNQRDSVSGVSIDEEMTNLVKFQQAYDASARFITTIANMFDTLINKTGS